MTEFLQKKNQFPIYTNFDCKGETKSIKLKYKVKVVMIVQIWDMRTYLSFMYSYTLLNALWGQTALAVMLEPFQTVVDWLFLL